MIGFDGARHLLARTGFGGRPDEIGEFAGLDRDAAVDRLLASLLDAPRSPLPEWSGEAPPSPEERRTDREAFVAKLRTQAMELKAWWFREMLATPSPLTERLTLFWHNHFTSGLRKVKSPALMARQNLTWRRHVAGNFGAFLKDACRDPAMVLYLDTQTNRPESPNENFARELMELFTLGERRYTESDIREAARAFTGYKVDPVTGEFVFARRMHDDGIKTVLGHAGSFGGDDICDVLLSQDDTARTIVRKLWREFISQTPDDALVETWAKDFRSNGYELKPLLRTIFVADAFCDPENRGVLVKSPVEFIVGTLRLLEIPVEDARILAVASDRMGQDIFDPPNVKGWPGGNEWINSATLLARRQFVSRAVRGREMMNGRPTGEPWWRSKVDAATPEGRETARLVFLAVPPTQPESADRAIAEQWMLDPAFQLK